MPTQTNEKSAGQLKSQFNSLTTSREKYWKELSPDERVERMRSLIKSMSLTLNRLTREKSDLIDILWNHSHDKDGSVILKIDKEKRYKIERSNYPYAKDFYEGTGVKDKDEVYI